MIERFGAPMNCHLEKPIRVSVKGSPFQPGDRVRILNVVDKEVIDMSSWIGKIGVVIALWYEGFGQTYPGDPMVSVRVSRRKRDAFWKEELELVTENK